MVAFHTWHYSYLGFYHFSRLYYWYAQHMLVAFFFWYAHRDRYLFLFQFFFIYNLFLWFSGISEIIRIHASSMSNKRLHSRFDKNLYQNSYADHDCVNLLPWDLHVYSTLHNYPFICASFMHLCYHHNNRPQWLQIQTQNTSRSLNWNQFCSYCIVTNFWSTLETSRYLNSGLKCVPHFNKQHVA